CQAATCHRSSAVPNICVRRAREACADRERARRIDRTKFSHFLVASTGRPQRGEASERASLERDSELWSEVNPSRFPWEREGLAFIREALPPSAPYRGWANVEFVGDDGSINEIDCLVVGRTGIFLVELKGHPGRMSGNAHTWRWTPPEAGSTTRTIDNPLL